MEAPYGSAATTSRSLHHRGGWNAAAPPVVATDVSHVQVVSELHGRTSIEGVERWKAKLHADLAAVPSGASVRLLVDLTGYEPAGLDVHKGMRTVVPRLLADHGMRPALADLFPEVPELEVAPAPAVVIEAFATVHHEAEKMDRFEAVVGTDQQRFFTDRHAAQRWLSTMSVGAGQR